MSGCRGREVPRQAGAVELRGGGCPSLAIASMGTLEGPLSMTDWVGGTIYL